MYIGTKGCIPGLDFILNFLFIVKTIFGAQCFGMICNLDQSLTYGGMRDLTSEIYGSTA